MRLDKLIVNRLPGIPDGFTLETDATVCVVIGPNGSGKSSLSRAVRHLFWAEEKPGTPFSVEAFFTWQKTPWKAVREEGMETRWMHDGQQADAPDLPGGHVARCYELGILDLVLPAGGEVEQQLAGIINREMSGGVNLAQISEDIFSFGSRLASRRNSDFQEATNTFNALVRNRKQLSEQESELVGKRQELAKSIKASSIFDLLQILKKYNKTALDLEAVRCQIDTFERGQKQIRQDDTTTLANLTRQQQDKHRQAQQARTELDIRVDQLKSVVLPENMIDPDLLARQVSQAADLEKDIRNLQEGFVRQEEILHQTLMELDPDTDVEAAGPQPGREVYSDLTQAYARMAGLKASAEGLDALLALPELHIQTPGPEIKEAYDKLRLWLEKEDTGKGTSPIPGLVAGLVAAATGWLLWVSTKQPAGPVAMVLGTTLAGYSAWRWIQGSSLTRQHQSLSSEIADLCREANIPLDHPLTNAQARRLLDERTRAEAANQTRQSLREYLSGQHQRRENGLEQSLELLEQLRRKHGLALNRETSDLINLLNVVPRYRDARDETTALQAGIVEKQQELDAVLKTIGTAFTGLGFDKTETTMEAQHQLEKLETRLTRIETLLGEQKTYQKELKRVQLDLKDVEDNISTFWTRLGVPAQSDDHLVRQLVDKLPQWNQTLEEESRLRQQLEFLDKGFRSDPSLLDPQEAEKLTEDELDSRLEELLADTQARDGINTAISRIELQVEQARKSREVAEAQAQAESAKTNLRETRELERETTLGQLLLEDVEQTYHHSSRPRVLARASENFNDFTQGVYELRIVPGENRSGCFAAFHTEKKENLGLGELSDGTRAQLLLAVRLAFIAENEGAAKPPIFLDESLTSSDPERFAAIADKLAGWAGRNDRQVFYLSSNPNDGNAWKSALKQSGLPQPEIFDLARARGKGLGKPLTYGFEDTTIPPSADQMTAAEYAEVLGVPNLNPWQQNTETHLWYLLQDDLSQLHRLLVIAAPTLGRFLARKNEMETLGSMSLQKISNLEARGHCLDAFFRNWRIGRNRPVTAETLINSGAIGDKFLDPCRELLNDVGGDSAEFLKGLKDKKVKRFASKKIDALEMYFQLENFLDPRDVLPEEDLLGNVLSVVGPEIHSSSLEVGEVRHLVLNWLKILNGIY